MAPVGKITVKCEAGVKVILDGADKGVTDATGLVLEGVTEGEHKVRLEKPGCESQEFNVTVAQDKTNEVTAAVFAKSTNPRYLIKTSMGDITVELFPAEAPKTVKNFTDLAEGKKEWTDPKTKEKVKRPFFDGLVFHRCIKNFMIQGGCPLGLGRGSPGYKFEDEISAKALGLDKIKAMAGNRPNKLLLIRDQQGFFRTILMPLIKKMGISREQVQARMAEIQKKMGEMTIEDVYVNLGYKYNDSLKSRKLTKGVLAMANSGPNTNGSQFFLNLIDTPWLNGKHTVFGKVVAGMDVIEKIGNVEVEQPSARPKTPITIVSIRLVKDK